MFCPECGYENNEENKFCMSCGKDIKHDTEGFSSNRSDEKENLSKQVIRNNVNNWETQNCSYVPMQINNCVYTEGAQTIRLIVGIISIVLSPLIGFQSFAAGAVNAFLNNEAMDGTAGLILSLVILTTGIISIATRKTKGGIITAISFYLFGAVIGLAYSEIFADLIIWSVAAVIFASLLAISLTMTVEKTRTKTETSAEQSIELQCPYHYKQKLEVIFNGSSADIYLYQWDDDCWEKLLNINGYIGNGNIYSDNRITPKELCDISFCFGLEKPDTKLNFIMLDPNSADDTYNQFVKDGYFSSGIYFGNNVDMYEPISELISQNKSYGMIVCDYKGSAKPVYGCIHISSSDMKSLLKFLDSSKNPVIRIL
ncbi:MAG: zinc-ribbon domain-containing protein [Clostridium sp.]|nr:zinc-ribbon domain-containing protein [Clostridium sp.]